MIKYEFKLDKTKKELEKKKRCKLTNKYFVNICKFTKEDLKSYLHKELKKYYKTIINSDGFLYAKGNDKIAVTAHMDTTPSVDYGKRKSVKDVYEFIEKGKHILYSPQGIGGDDRCGIYMILKILENTELRPTIIFCEDEEIGCIGSDKFTKSKYIDDLKEMYFIIPLDRRGSNDLVFYDDENEKFHKYCEEITGYEENYGSCSDISYLCPACGIAGVNISCGYYNEHHDYETVNLDEMERTLNTTIKLIKDGIKNETKYEYIEHVYTKYKYDYNNLNFGTYQSCIYSNNYNSLIDEYDDYEIYYLEIDFVNEEGLIEHIDYTGDTLADCWYEFLSKHPTLRMANVLDYNEYSENELYNTLDNKA